MDYSLNGVYELLKRLNMGWISARSVSPNADPLKEAKFKTIWSRKYRRFADQPGRMDADHRSTSCSHAAQSATDEIGQFAVAVTGLSAA